MEQHKQVVQKDLLPAAVVVRAEQVKGEVLGIQLTLVDLVERAFNFLQLLGIPHKQDILVLQDQRPPQLPTDMIHQVIFGLLAAAEVE